MWTFKNKAIPWKLKVVIMATTFAALLVTCTALFTYERIAFKKNLTQDLSTLAHVIADNSVTSVAVEQAETAREILAALDAEPQILAACIYGKDGKVFVQHLRPGANRSIPSYPPAEGYHWEKDHLAYAVPLMDRKINERVGTIFLLADFRSMRSRLALYTLVVGLVLMVSFAVAYVLSDRLQRVISGPILDLAETARMISEHKDYSVRARKQSEDELGNLVDAFNLMLTQIQQQDQALRMAKEELERRVEERTRKLQELQRQNELILNSAGEGIYGLDLAGRMAFVNPTAAKTIGWTVEELVHKPEHLILRHSNPAGIPYRQEECPVCAHFRVGKPYLSADETLWRKDGTSFPAEYVRTPILENGQLVGAVVVFKDITEHKRAEQELALLNKKLQETSRQAGMQEVATGVLHNVGNVLNSVNVSANLLGDRVRQIRISGLHKLAAVLREHASDLSAFLKDDPKGQVLPGYLAGLAENLTEDQIEMRHELDLLSKNINHIKDIIAMQQSYGKVSGMMESVPVASLVEDALQIDPDPGLRRDIQVVREYEEVPLVTVDKHKVLQILVNLIRNARYALKESARPDKKLTLRIRMSDHDRIRIEIEDNGVGILPENLTRVFSHGFTTKQEGHGFGLHSGAIAAREIGGTLAASSGGPGRGATFTLELPSANPRPLL